MWKLGLCGILSLWLCTACGQDEAAKEPLKMPKKEETWVKTEKVDITREDALAARPGAAEIPVNQGLLDKLTSTSGPAPKSPIKDADTCLALLRPLDETRMFVQREGGAWHMFERSDLIRPFSDNGMQIDSNLNKLVFSLRHLCKTADGVPLNSLATRVNGLIKEKGREEARRHLIEVVGEAPADADLWLGYTDFANQNAARKVPYSEIQTLILQTQPLIDLYQDLLNRKVDESNKDQFLSDSMTLLTVANNRVTKEPRVVMAMKEDTEPPLHSRWEM